LSTTTCSSSASSTWRSEPGKSADVAGQVGRAAEQQPLLGVLDQGLDQHRGHRGDDAAQLGGAASGQLGDGDGGAASGRPTSAPLIERAHGGHVVVGEHLAQVDHALVDPAGCR
jgi:hypothetical protein